VYLAVVTHVCLRLCEVSAHAASAVHAPLNAASALTYSRRLTRAPTAAYTLTLVGSDLVSQSPQRIASHSSMRWSKNSALIMCKPQHWRYPCTAAAQGQSNIAKYSCTELLTPQTVSPPLSLIPNNQLQANQAAASSPAKWPRCCC